MFQTQFGRFDSSFNSNNANSLGGDGDATKSSAKFLGEYIQPKPIPKSPSNCIVEFVKSTVNAALVDPVRATSQIIDNTTHSKYDQKIQTLADSVGLTPSAPAEFGTTQYFAQQLGNAVGMMVPFMLLKGGGGKIAGAMAERKALVAAEQSVTPSLLNLASKEAFASGATGFAYGTFFRTTEDQSSKSGFWEKRFHQGVGDATTFGVLGFTNPYVGKALNSAALSLERSASIESALLAGDATKFATAPAKATAAYMLRSPIIGGALSSIPAGLWNAEMQARRDGRWVPTGTELKENLVSMAFVGGAFGAAHSLYSSRTNPAETLPSKVGQPNQIERSNLSEQPNQAEHAVLAEQPNRAEQTHQVDQPGQVESPIRTTFASPEAAMQYFRTSIEEGNWKQVGELVKDGTIDAKVLQDPTVSSAIYEGFDRAISVPPRNWSNIRDIIQIGGISPEHYATPAIKQTAFKDLGSRLGEFMHSEVADLLETKILSEKELRYSPELRKTTGRALHKALESRADRTRQFDHYSWIDADIKHEAAIKCVRDKVGGYSSHTDADNLVKKVAGTKWASEAELRATAQEALAQRVSKGQLEDIDQFGNQYYGADWAQTPALRSAALLRIQNELTTGVLRTTEQALAQGLIDLETIRTDVNKQLNADGLAYLLKQNFGLSEISERCQKSAELFGEIAPETFRAALVDTLPRYLTSADTLHEFTEMARNTVKVEFTPAEMRKAASKVVTESLTHWDPHEAQAVIDLNILSAEEVKDAVAAAIPRSIEHNPAVTAHLPKVYEIDETRVKTALSEAATAGNITNALRTALLRGADLKSALSDYAGISELTNVTARNLYERLKTEDHVWADRNNVRNFFELGMSEFGEARMLRFALNGHVSPHDALLSFDHVRTMYKKSGMTPEAFDGKILSQVGRDSGVDNLGSAYSHLQSIAKSFPANAREVLTRAREAGPEFKSLADSFGETGDGIFADWNNLKRFGKLQHLLEQRETLEQLAQLEKSGQVELAGFVKTLLFHPDSRVALEPIIQFWQDPGKFLDLADKNTNTAHDLKKPSNYTDIPHLDMTPVQLRDALIDGTLDKLQVFNPMRIEYELAPRVDINKEFDRALGARRENRQGTAKNVPKLFSEVNRVLKSDPSGYTVSDLVSGKELPASLHHSLMELLYNDHIGVPKPETNMRLIAEIHRKSDPIAVLAGDDTVSCMGFGTGKNNIYMFNPNDAQFTVRIVNQEGKVRTIAQSVLTKDKDVKQSVSKIVESMDGNQKVHVHDLLSTEALRSSPSIVAADNIEVHPKYTGLDHQMALEAVYADFFNQYLQKFGEEQNLRTDKVVIGVGYTDVMKGLPQEPNTYVPQAPVAYSDKLGDTVYRLDMNRHSEWTATPTKIEVTERSKANQEKPTTIQGVAPLTFEDTLPVSWLEGKAYQDNPAMIEGLHNMENSLIAQAINNTATGRPNMSLKYTSPDGTAQGYLVAYEGKFGEGENQSRVVFVSDYSTDRTIGRNGLPKAGRAGGKLLQAFMDTYKTEYLDKGDITPVLANAREETSYKLLVDNLKLISKRIGYDFDVQEVGTHNYGTSVMHDILIVPRRKN